ncbi:MAG: hypothetical protein P8009_01300 [Gammaproteobacteria bacterium]
MTEPPVPPDAARVVSARSARFAARVFNYGNIVAMIVPVPLGILWLGASMLVYALNRHNPNPRVGHYTQQAAYRLYGVMGFIIVVATFFGTNVTYWLITWAISALVLIPWSIIDLRRINNEDWQDTLLEEEKS